MIGDKNIAEDSSVAINGDNVGIVNNYAIKDVRSLYINTISPQATRKLPSLLSAIILNISEQSLAEYSKGERRELPPDGMAKLKYNNINLDCPLMREHARFSLVLERAYRGVEQRNSDAHFLVIRMTGIIYSAELDKACAEFGIADDQRDVFVRKHAMLLVQRVIRSILDGYAALHEHAIYEEAAHFAVSLIVADAIIECEVLQRPTNATSP